MASSHAIAISAKLNPSHSPDNESRIVSSNPNAPQPQLKEAPAELAIGAHELDVQIEAPERCPIEKLGVIGGGDDQACAAIGVHQLQERRDDSPHLADVLFVAAGFSD